MFDKRNLIQIPHSEITWCYHTLWQGGIVAGVCRWRSDEYYVECFEQGLDDGERSYALFRLMDGEWMKLKTFDGWTPDVWGRVPVGFFEERTDVNETQ